MEDMLDNIPNFSGTSEKLQKEASYGENRSKPISLRKSKISHASVMMSYSWTQQSMVEQIRNECLKEGIPMWMDKYNKNEPKGYLDVAIADAIEKAEIVLICISQDYEDSHYCQAEAGYAFKLNKIIIPLKMMDAYKATGWLGLYTAGRYYYDFSGKHPFREKMSELITWFHKRLGIKQVRDTGDTVQDLKALKEKEEHIEQLLKERDLERSEVARAAAKCDEAEGQMSMMRGEQERYKQDVDDTVLKLRSLVADMQQEKVELVNQLDTEKRKVKDLQFQIEEEAMTKDDIESRTEEEEEMKFREIERLQQREKERADKLEQELYAMKAMAKDNTEKLESTEELNITYLDQIEEITHKLSQAETKIKGYESNRLEEGAKQQTPPAHRISPDSAEVKKCEDYDWMRYVPDIPGIAL